MAILPILLYHGDDKMKRETPRLMFPEAPKEMLQYIPRFNYITININKLSDASIAKIEHILFQKFLFCVDFMVLKSLFEIGSFSDVLNVFFDVISHSANDI